MPETPTHIRLFRVTTVPVSLYTLLNGQLRFMKEHGFDPVMISAPGPLVEEVKQQQNCDHIALPLTRTISPLKDLVAVWKFYKLCRREKPAIVHSHTPKAGIVAMLGAYLAGVPIRLHTVAGLPLMEARGIKRFILERVEKLTYACATKVYPNSGALARFMTENKLCNECKLKVLGKGSSNGINTKHYARTVEVQTAARQVAGQYHIHPGDFVFVFVGRIVRDKGVVEMVKAFMELCREHKQIKLLLVGEFEHELDPLPADTLELIRKQENIIHVGFQKDVRPYLAVSQALVFPSYREGFPNVPMQAGCLDLPAIVTDINGCNEIVVEEENGLIIPVKNAEALETAMWRLINHKELYEQMKAKARPMIVQRYDQQEFWNILLSEYHLQLNKHELL